MAEQYQLEKRLWDETDFDMMGWHDASIHAFSFSKDYKLFLDIDYIFKWVHPEDGETYFNFWVAPCTLAFENVWNIVFDLELSVPSELSIDSIVRSNPNVPRNAGYTTQSTEYTWTIETLNGDITFNSVGYSLYVRQQPLFVKEQMLDIDVRGGISFETNTY